jgi:hypothetical protein
VAVFQAPLDAERGGRENALHATAGRGLDPAPRYGGVNFPAGIFEILLLTSRYINRYITGMSGALWKSFGMVLVGSVLPLAGLPAQTLWTGTSTADAFLAAGSPGNPLGSDLTANNYGGAGTLAIAPAGSTKGEFQSLVMFSLAPALSTFDAAYGAGNWQITNITLTLASNFGDPGEQPNNGIFNAIHT